MTPYLYRILKLNKKPWIKYWLYKKGEKLPAEYQRIKYLETDGTQYIDTEFIANQDTRFIMDIKYINGNFIFGSDGDATGRVNAVGLNHNTAGDKFRWHYDNQAYTDSGTLEANVRYVIDCNKNNMYLNGVLQAEYTYSDFETPTGVIISGIRRGNVEVPAQLSSLYIYSFKIYDDETLALDLIPCYRKSDNKQGMYDLVNDTFLPIN